MTDRFREFVGQSLIQHMIDGDFLKADPEKTPPFNPISGNQFSGINQLWLDKQGFDDPRWLTAKQIRALGKWREPGAKATEVEVWQWKETRPVKVNGKPLKDELGNPVTEEVKLDKPRVIRAKVYNAQQIKGGLETTMKPDGFGSKKSFDQAHNILKTSGIEQSLDQKSFGSVGEYYKAAMQQSGWKAAESLGGENGPMDDLSAELSAYFISTQMGLGYKPRTERLKEIGTELAEKGVDTLFKAAEKAQKAVQWLKSPEKRKEIELSYKPSRSLWQNVKERFQSRMSFDEKQEINVPYEERNVAQGMGAEFNRNQKQWTVKTNDHGFTQWNPKMTVNVRLHDAKLNPVEKDGLKDQAVVAKHKRDKNLEQKRDKAAQRAVEKLHKGELLTSDNPLMRDVKRDEKGRTMIPLRDMKGKIWNVQTIDPDGKKRTLPFGKKDALFHPIGFNPKQDKPKEIIIANGFKAGMAIGEATNQPVIVSFDQNSLKTLAADVKKQFPKAAIIIAQKEDKTLSKGKAIASEIGAKIVVPPSLKKDQDKSEKKDFDELSLGDLKKTFQLKPQRTKAKARGMGV